MDDGNCCSIDGGEDVVEVVDSSPVSKEELLAAMSVAGVRLNAPAAEFAWAMLFMGETPWPGNIETVNDFFVAVHREEPFARDGLEGEMKDLAEVMGPALESEDTKGMS